MGYVHDTEDPKFAGMTVETRLGSVRFTLPDHMIGDFHRSPADNFATIELSYASLDAFSEAIRLVQHHIKKPIT